MNKETYIKYLFNLISNHISYEKARNLLDITYKPTLNAENVIKYCEKKGYKIYTDKPNIIGVRNNIQNYSQFDDWMFVILLNEDKTVSKSYMYPWTTDPSTFYVKQRITNSKGTAKLKAGQYIDAYKIGLHKGRHEALVQHGKNPVTVERLDKEFNTVTEETGYFGINIHGPTGRDELQEAVSYSSAGCQVAKKMYYLKQFLQIIKRFSNLYHTYTLIELEDYNDYNY